VLSRFVTRRSIRAALLFGLLFGGFTLVNAVGYKAAYPSELGRQQIAASLSSNAGLKMLLGEPSHLETVAGFTDWRVLGTVALIGSIWAFLLATKTFRGEESAGRWELFLAGQTTARRATANALGGLGLCAVAMFVLVAALVAVATPSIETSVPVYGALSYAVAVVSFVALFMAVGACTSQLMPTRARAATLAALVFGVCFLLRGVGDSAPSVHWLVNLSPLGWIENIHPLTSNHVIWFAPVWLLVAVLVTVTLALAGRRDMDSSLFADADTAKPRLKLLTHPLTVAFRLNKTTTLAWAIGTSLIALMFGSLAKTAGSALAASSQAQQLFSRLSSSGQIAGSLTFLGIVFMILMLLVMLFVAGSIGSVREEEAEGYLDNLLTRPVSRTQWLLGRVLLVGLGVALIALLAGVTAWAGAASQHSGVGLHDLFTASLNAMAPAAFVLGVGVLIFGFMPRLTSVTAYGIIIWSFIVQLVGSIINLNHWILDLSLLHHITLAPATSPNWTSAGILAGIGVLAGCAGVLRFRGRDLENA